MNYKSSLANQENKESNNDNLNFYQSQIYNRKIAELFEKICDDSTTICIQGDNVIAIKLKVVTYLYSWDKVKLKFIVNKNSKMNKFYYDNIFANNKDSYLNKYSNYEFNKCTIYNKSLAFLFSEISKDSAIILALDDYSFFSLKTKSVFINYVWDNNKKEFLSKKSKNLYKKRDLKKDFYDIDDDLEDL